MQHVAISCSAFHVGRVAAHGTTHMSTRRMLLRPLVHDVSYGASMPVIQAPRMAVIQALRLQVGLRLIHVCGTWCRQQQSVRRECAWYKRRHQRRSLLASPRSLSLLPTSLAPSFAL